MEICAGGAASDARTGVVRMGAMPPLRVMQVALCHCASTNAGCGMGRRERRLYGSEGGSAPRRLCARWGDGWCDLRRVESCVVMRYHSSISHAYRIDAS